MGSVWHGCSQGKRGHTCHLFVMPILRPLYPRYFRDVGSRVIQAVKKGDEPDVREALGYRGTCSARGCGTGPWYGAVQNGTAVWGERQGASGSPRRSTAPHRSSQRGVGQGLSGCTGAGPRARRVGVVSSLTHTSLRSFRMVSGGLGPEHP